MGTERELPMLGGIAACLRWCEELLAIVSGPILTFGLGIALVDLLTDGRLTATVPALLFAWAVSQAVGVDSQLVGAWDKARQAARARRWGVLAGMVVLGVALSYVAIVAALVFATQQSGNTTVGEALHRLGMDGMSWLVQRSVLSVVLVALSGWTRYHPPAKDAAADAATERARLERELALEPLRQAVRARRVMGAATLARQTLVAAAGRTAETAPTLDVPPVPLDVPRTVKALPKPPVRSGPSGPLGGGRRPRRLPREDWRSVEPQARAAWESGAWREGMTARAMARAAGISATAASTWYRILRAEAKRAA